MQLQNQKLFENPYHPFEYKEQFDLAYWLLATDQPISKTRIIAMIKLHSQDPYPIESRFNNYQHFTDTIDNIEYNLPWSSASLDVPPALKKVNSGWNDSLTFHYRNALDCVRSLFSQTSLLGHMEYAPKRMFDAQGNRIYTDLSSSNWWWEIQAKLPSGATVLPVILGSDATQLSILSGNAKAWPVYISIGNISKSVRYLGKQQALILLGYLPIPHCKALRIKLVI